MSEEIIGDKIVSAFYAIVTLLVAIGVYILAEGERGLCVIIGTAWVTSYIHIKYGREKWHNEDIMYKGERYV
jgi:hypothetical protein